MDEDFDNTEAVALKLGFDISDAAKEKAERLGPEKGTEYIAELLGMTVIPLFAGLLYSQMQEDDDISLSDILDISVPLAASLIAVLIECKASGNLRPISKFLDIGNEIMKSQMEQASQNIDSKTQEDWSKQLNEWLKDNSKDGSQNPPKKGNTDEEER